MNDKITKLEIYYDLTSEDKKLLQNHYNWAKSHINKFTEGFYERIFLFSHAKAFLSSSEIVEFHKTKFSEWFLQLFSGKFDQEDMEFLAHIGVVHARIGLPSHYINASFGYIRAFLREITHTENKFDLMRAIDKILDINLDLLTRTQSDSESENLLGMVTKLHTAINEDRVVPFFQPIVDRDGKTVKYEALVRIIEPDGTAITPNHFLEISEKTGLYHLITKTVVEKSLAIFADRSEGISINLSTNDLLHTPTREFLINTLSNFIDPSRVTLEFLESHDLIFNDSSLSFINSMKILGVSLAIDDFGSGFSNYQNLSKIKADLLKIDGSLIKDIDSDSTHKLTVASIIALAKELNIKTVAEFVSSEAISKIVKELGIDYMQGYYFGAPKELIKS